jgi:hypothetical protein
MLGRDLDIARENSGIQVFFQRKHGSRILAPEKPHVNIPRENQG